jgi:hypothetical protein
VLSRDRDNSAHHERCRELDIQDHGSGDSGVLNTGNRQTACDTRMEGLDLQVRFGVVCNRRG